MRQFSAQCGHVKRRLSKDEPVTGKVLEFALGVIDENVSPKGGATNNFLNGIAEKLKAGEKLSEYEYHVFVEVLLLNKKLEG